MSDARDNDFFLISHDCRRSDSESCHILPLDFLPWVISILGIGHRSVIDSAKSDGTHPNFVLPT